MKKFALLLAAMMLFAAGCGSDASQSSVSGEAPDAVGDADTVGTAEGSDDGSSPDAAELSGIISLSPTATEILFAIGAGDQVIAVDEFSDYPAEAPTTDLSGYEPNLEAIAEFAPQTVVLSNAPEEFIAGLKELGIVVLAQDAASTVEDTYAQISDLGALTGHEDQAASLVADIGATLDDLTLPATGGAPATYYHELDPSYYSATSSTFIGEVYNRLGLVNIADEADADGFGYPQLTEEYILEADPDFIFLADTKCCGESADTVAARPGWDALTAVRNGQVVELDDDIVSRWGPRVTEFMRVVADAVANSLIPA